jgi:tRNA A-37 threonylcarbamoyl transferase component Bud32
MRTMPRLAVARRGTYGRSRIVNRERIGRYEIVRLLARGGMAVVYLVRQPTLDREVVLKRVDLESDDSTLAQRFVHEARLAATLNHPNVVTLFDFFEEDGVPYIAMEYVDGGSLRGLIGTLGLPQVLGVAEGVLAGLGHAEHHGIVHRDLKPENVLITQRGGVKIADFGIARAYNTATQRLTHTGMAMGTPSYMAPEQALNEPLGSYTDLYAVGVIVFELLAGRAPFEADTPMTVLYSHVHKPPPPLAELAPDVPRRVCEWVEWLLAKAPADRPASADQAWDALEEIAVAELGPYWRRVAKVLPRPRTQPEQADEDDGTLVTTATRDHTKTTRLPERTAVAPVAEAPPRGGPLQRHRRAAAVTAALAIPAAAITVAVVSSAGDSPARRPTPAPVSRAAAAPYDFDGDGRPELVAALLRGSTEKRGPGSGVVLIHHSGGPAPWRLVTHATAKLPGRPRTDDNFGSGLAGGDFNADGHADLAIGTPGRSRVSVLYGTAAGLGGGRRQQLSGSGRYGFALHAHDVNGDGVDDLMVSAPGELPSAPGAGSMQVIPGSRRGLDTERAAQIEPVARTLTGFGLRFRAGDFDADGHVDVVEGSPPQGTAPGHLTYCHGSSRWPQRCRELGAGSATSSLAVADVNDDQYDDIVQGDSKHGQFIPPGAPGTGGEVRLWLGGRLGPRPEPIHITQNSPEVPGLDEPGDEFGGVVAAGRVDSDGYADLIVGVPREDDGAGRIAVIRGGRDGIALEGHTSFGQQDPGVPGAVGPDREFGATLALLQLTSDRRLDLAVAAQGATAADDRIMVIEGGPGIFTPSETRTRTLPGIGRRVIAPTGGLIRFARTGTG